MLGEWVLFSYSIRNVMTVELRVPSCRVEISLVRNLHTPNSLQHTLLGDLFEYEIRYINDTMEGETYLITRIRSREPIQIISDQPVDDRKET